MRKRITPLALLFGMITAMLLGGTSMAQADPDSTCTNGVTVGVVICDAVIQDSPITVNITGNRVLTDNEINILENSLSDIQILSISNIQIAVANVYNSFNPPITINAGNVTATTLPALPV